jgi:hypothetical protein
MIFVIDNINKTHFQFKKSHQDSKGERRKAHRELGTGYISPNNTNPAKI